MDELGCKNRTRLQKSGSLLDCSNCFSLLPLMAISNQDLVAPMMLLSLFFHKYATDYISPKRFQIAFCFWNAFKIIKIFKVN